MLIIFSGRSGTGKTTLSRKLARHLGAVHVRVDTIEQAMMGSTGEAPGETGYLVAYAVAEDNLRVGRVVVADSVNPLDITRNAWRSVAERAGVPSVEVEITCSDGEEHRRRIEARRLTDAAPAQLTWDDVIGREFQPWGREHIVVDTAGRTFDECFADLCRALAC